MTGILILLFSIILMTVIGLFIYLSVVSGGDKRISRRITKIRERFSTSEEAMKKRLRGPLLSSSFRKQNLKGIDLLAANVNDKLRAAGINISFKQFAKIWISGVVILFLALLVMKMKLLVSIAVAVGFGVLVPRIMLEKRAEKRIQSFILLLPDAIDLMVRSLRSGVSISESVALAGKEVDEPLGHEFRTASEAVKIGRRLEDALLHSADSFDCPEFRFFIISLTLQRETGGNLTETLDNLSKMLRKRTQMRLKIRALSSEARASAYIVGVLPFLVFGMIWFVNAEYLAPFFNDPRLTMVGVGALVWMGIGIFIMNKMTNFEI